MHMPVLGIRLHPRLSLQSTIPNASTIRGAMVLLRLRLVAPEGGCSIVHVLPITSKRLARVVSLVGWDAHGHWSGLQAWRLAAF